MPSVESFISFHATVISRLGSLSGLCNNGKNILGPGDPPVLLFSHMTFFVLTMTLFYIKIVEELT